MAAVEEGRYDIVLTHSFDRMSRGTICPARFKHFRSTAYPLCRLSIKEDLDFSGPLGPVLMALLSALAEMQSNSISNHAKEDTI